MRRIENIVGFSIVGLLTIFVGLLVWVTVSEAGRKQVLIEPVDVAKNLEEAGYTSAALTDQLDSKFHLLFHSSTFNTWTINRDKETTLLGAEDRKLGAISIGGSGFPAILSLLRRQFPALDNTTMINASFTSGGECQPGSVRGVVIVKKPRERNARSHEYRTSCISENNLDLATFDVAYRILADIEPKQAAMALYNLNRRISGFGIGMERLTGSASENCRRSFPEQIATLCEREFISHQSAKLFHSDDPSDHVFGLQMWGEYSAEHGDYDAAFKHLNLALEIDPRPETYVALGTAQEKKGRSESSAVLIGDSVSNYMRAVNWKPPYKPAFAPAGRAMLNPAARNYPKAIELFTAAAADDAKSWDPLFGLALAKTLLADERTTQQSMAKGTFTADLERLYDEAVDSGKQAAKNDADYGFSYFAWGFAIGGKAVALERFGQYSRAADEAGRAAEKFDLCASWNGASDPIEAKRCSDLAVGYRKFQAELSGRQAATKVKSGSVAESCSALRTAAALYRTAGRPETAERILSLQQSMPCGSAAPAAAMAPADADKVRQSILAIVGAERVPLKPISSFEPNWRL